MAITGLHKGYRIAYGHLDVAVVQELEGFAALVQTLQGEVLFKGEPQGLEDAQRRAIDEARAFLSTDASAPESWAPYGYSAEAIALATAGFEDVLGERRFLPVHEAEQLIWTAPWLLLSLD